MDKCSDYYQIIWICKRIVDSDDLSLIYQEKYYNMIDN